MRTALTSTCLVLIAGGSPWTAEDKDYVVLDAGRVIGRIVLDPQAPAGMPWFWTITDLRLTPPSAHNTGYCATREEATAAFEARWLANWSLN